MLRMSDSADLANSKPGISLGVLARDFCEYLLCTSPGYSSRPRFSNARLEEFFQLAEGGFIPLIAVQRAFEYVLFN